MNKFAQIFNAILAAEENIIPVFIHSTQANGIVGILLAAEEVAAQFIQSLPAFKSATTPPAPAAAPAAPTTAPVA